MLEHTNAGLCAMEDSGRRDRKSSLEDACEDRWLAQQAKEMAQHDISMSMGEGGLAFQLRQCRGAYNLLV